MKDVVAQPSASHHGCKTRDQLVQLRDRLAAATGPDRELDLHIRGVLIEEEHAFVAENRLGSFREGYEPMESVWPRYTASIDAAVTLVPEGVQWEAIGGNGCKVADAYVALSYDGDIYLNDSQALTVPLAICQAIIAYHLSLLGDTKAQHPVEEPADRDHIAAPPSKDSQ